MSWLFSQALVEEYSAATCSDGEQCAPSSGQPIQQAYCSPDKMTEFSRLSRFGMMFKPLTDGRGEELLTLYLAGFRAKTSVPQGGGRESKEPAAACGSTWPALSARFDPDTSSWKTAHCLWEEDLQWSSVTLPRWGMTRSGFVFLHPTSERPISATASGLWPTPTVPNGGRSMTPEMAMNGGYTSDGQKRQIGLENAVKYWPTPTVFGNHNRKGASKNSGDGLATAVRQWPTPTCSLGTKGGRITPRKGREGGTLIEAVSARTWPTPVTSMAKGSSPASLTRKDGQDRSNDRLDHAVMASDGGQLNPTWVEWLMGWPLGWTDLKPLEMDRFLEWQQQHSIFSAETAKGNKP